MMPHIESAVQESGLRIFQLLEEESPSVFKKEYWTGKVLDWAMHDDEFKVQMFRFVDVFPYLNGSESIVRHLQEYFLKPGLHLPSALQWGIRFISPSSIAAKVLARTVSANIYSMARHFITGANPKEALPAFKRLRRQGMAFSVDLLGEAVVSETEAEEYLTRYLDLLDFLSKAAEKWNPLGGESDGLDWGFSPKVHVSIKTTALYSQMNSCAFNYSIEMAKKRLRPILRKAMDTGAFITLDMEHYGIKNLTLSLYRSLMEEPEFTSYPHTGIVIQSYLRDSERDLLEMISWAEKHKVDFTIRLVKGAYWDSEVIHARQNNWPIPVFTRKDQTDANFEKLATIILQNQELITLACASHNIRSIAYVMEAAKELQIPKDRLEFQVLYGMGEPVRNALRKTGLPVRVYAPVGAMFQGMAYLVRRLLENTANESFLRRSFAEGVPREELLRNPLEISKGLENAGEVSNDPSGAESANVSETFSKKDSLNILETLDVENDQMRTFTNEPRFDWSLSENRRNFSEALERVKNAMPMQIPLSIAGQEVHVAKKIHSQNPNAPEEIIGIVSSAGENEVNAAVSAAKDALISWRETSPEVRAEYLFNAADAARRMRYDLAALQVFEVGKGWTEADADVCEAIDFLEYYGREMLRLSVPRRMGAVPGEISKLFYEPRGVTAVIAPWNFPMAISTGMISAAIVTGNTVVYKPASQSPVVGWMIYRIFEEVKLPPGVFNFLPGSGSEIGDRLVTHPEIALISFTGSKDVGLRILRLANMSDESSVSLKAVIAEMGGKNAIIIDSDADLDEAIIHVVYSAFGYQGQKCSACSRLIVLQDVYEKLIERLKAAAESIQLGSPEDPKNFMGAVIEASAQKKIMKYIGIGKEHANLLLERSLPAENGYVVPLTIFTDVDPGSRLAQEEIFGPVLSIIKVADFNEALAVANGTQYALTGGVFSRSPENIRKASKNFHTGNVYINRGCTGAIVGRHPFGGFRMSGVGSKTGGPDYLLQFMVPRNVVENTLRRGFAPLDE